MTPVTTTKLGNSRVRVSPQERLYALDILEALGLEPHLNILQHIATNYQIDVTIEHLNGISEPTLSWPEVVRFISVIDTPEAKRWRTKAWSIFQRYLEGDVRLAAEVFEKSPPSERRWLSARLESIESRKRFMATIAKHGGEGDIFRHISSLSNQSVLKMNSQELRQQRKVRNTRDGMTADELLRLSYLETTSAEALEKSQVKGNDDILALHRKMLGIEKQLWDEPNEWVFYPQAA
jgi:hypothetical protein